MNTFKKFWKRKSVLFGALALSVIALFVVSICIGSSRLPLSEVFSALFGQGKGSPAHGIVVQLRLPRTVAALLSGLSLAVAGTVLQAVLHNPLASPGVIGINAGSGLFAVAAAALFPAFALARSAAAFLGALIAALSVYFIASKTGAGKTTLVLAGIAVSSFLAAATDAVITLVPDLQLDRLAFTMGGFSGTGFEEVAASSGFVLAGLIAALSLSYDLNVLSLGEETAANLGLRCARVRGFAILAVAVLAGAAISMAGLLSFVGLIVPHLMRRLAGSDNRVLVPASALGGAAFTLLCDILARTLFAPYEIPVGILLSFLGAPFFLGLLLSKKRKRRVKRSRPC